MLQNLLDSSIHKCAIFFQFGRKVNQSMLFLETSAVVKLGFICRNKL